MSFNEIKEVYRYLESLPSFQQAGREAARPGLERITSFCEEAGHPEHRVPYIHIAGSNGKGSVAVMLALAFEKAGYKCGLYTSPHLNHFRERIRIQRKEITEEGLIRFFQRYGSFIQQEGLSYFEVTTALAFWWFADQKADIGILETGLGGRLDATNVVNPEVSVITSVSLEHQDILGNTLEKIAKEKGGIIKKGRPVVVGNIPKRAKTTIEKLAKEAGSTCWEAQSLRPKHLKSGDLSSGDSFFQFIENHKKITIRSDLRAPVQCWNIALARLAIFCTEPRFSVTSTHFSEALKEVQKSGLLPGRFEKLENRLSWYFDGAHNPESVKELFRTIERLGWKEEPIMILSMMKEKTGKKMLKPFSVLKKNYYYRLQTERAADVSMIIPHIANIESLPLSEDEIINHLKGLTKQVVIFTGSLYFYSVVKKWVNKIIPAL